VNLLNETYALLDVTKFTYREIADGARVDVNWLVKFALRSIASPGAARVQNVHDFLATGRKVASKPVRIRSQSQPRRMREPANA
jgi:hypothetical protein